MLGVFRYDARLHITRQVRLDTDPLLAHKVEQCWILNRIHGMTDATRAQFSDRLPDCLRTAILASVDGNLPAGVPRPADVLKEPRPGKCASSPARSRAAMCSYWVSNAPSSFQAISTP